MKVAILTQPLGRNYGGLLQAYALQAYLKKLNVEVVTIDRKKTEKTLNSPKEKAIYTLKFTLGKLRGIEVAQNKEYIFENLYAFRSQNIYLTPLFTNDNQVLAHFNMTPYDLIIVGSDQVWRPKYSPSLGNFFCDFHQHTNSDAQRISYAASFGVDNWEFSTEQTESCKKLLKEFNAVTVRESSAVDLCKKHFEVDSEHVVDPTLLLDAEDYEKLIPVNSSSNFENKVLNYVLDPEKSKQQIANIVANTLDKEVALIMPQKKSVFHRLFRINPEQYIPVKEWLRAFKVASYVVTDSFHGCIFSILFNKPFIAIGNAERGLARFKSLLSMFNLEERLVLSSNEVTPNKVNATFDWMQINLYKEEHSEVGKNFLKKYVGNL